MHGCNRRAQMQKETRRNVRLSKRAAWEWVSGRESRARANKSKTQVVGRGAARKQGHCGHHGGASHRQTADLVGLLRLLGAGGDASADGPHGLVGDDNARLVLEGLEDGHDVLELRHALREHGIDALLADGQGLADAEDAHEALLKDVGELGRHELVALLGGGQAELAAALRVANEAALEAHVLHLVHRHLTGVGTAALEVAVLGRDHDARGELLVDHAHVQVRRAHVHVALVEELRAWRKVGNELVQLSGLGRVALPVASNDRLAAHCHRRICGGGGVVTQAARLYGLHKNTHFLSTVIPGESKIIKTNLVNRGRNRRRMARGRQ